MAFLKHFKVRRTFTKSLPVFFTRIDLEQIRQETNSQQNLSKIVNTIAFKHKHSVLYQVQKWLGYRLKRLGKLLCAKLKYVEIPVKSRLFLRTYMHDALSSNSGAGLCQECKANKGAGSKCTVCWIDNREETADAILYVRAKLRASFSH